MIYESLSPAAAGAALDELGHAAPAGSLVPQRRGDRWMVRLPGARMAWFAARGPALDAMRKERRVLRLVAERCGFAVPRVVGESADGAVDVRLPVPGPDDADAVFRRLEADPAAAARLGASVGAALAELHGSVSAADAAAWLPPAPDWPEPRAWVRERLPHVVDDPALLAAGEAVMARYEAVLRGTPPAERVLVHGDLGFHNTVIDPETMEVRGIFDWESACWADPHLDFRYLTHAAPSDPLLDAAIAAYEPRTGRRLCRGRIHLYNAASAVCYLAYRAGVPPDVRWCGRTLDEDLAWTRAALDLVC
jgi:aminoglycoside phosphotransferase (APT) family kinase protein